MLRHLFFAATLAAFLPAACAANPCDDACLKRVQEGYALAAKRKYTEALDMFDAARVAAPQAAPPLAAAAGLLANLSTRVIPEQRAGLRSQARALAERALALDADDPLAQEALRNLDEDAPPPLRNPNPAAARVLEQAEVFFTERRLDEALAKYKEAMVLDPQISAPWVGAGDCYFLRRQWSESEQFFRRATEIEPRNSQAWRFLADALIQQDKRKAGEQALLSAIAADPSQLPNWGKLALLHAAAGLPLKPLQWRRRVTLTPKADGTHEARIDAGFAAKADPPDLAFHLALAAGEVEARKLDKDKRSSAFDIELAAWRRALQLIDQADASSGKRPGEPALRQMQAFAADGQLEAALLVLTYRQSYRPALEAWLAREPGALKHFIDRYGVRP